MCIYIYTHGYMYIPESPLTEPQATQPTDLGKLAARALGSDHLKDQVLPNGSSGFVQSTRKCVAKKILREGSV